jgi:tetratricopeptide (TPR) repeat protein
MLSGLGRRGEAEAATREAVDVYRGLAKARPDAFLPYLAGSLNNLGNRLSELGRRGEAEAATREAVEIRRGLAKARPDAFLPDLATSLGAHGHVLLTANAPSAAADAFAEGLRILLPLLARYPAALMRLAFGLATDLDQACRASARPIPDDLAEPVANLLARATKT